MNRLIMFLIVGGILLTAVFALRYLRVVPNYQKEYLLEFSPTIKMSLPQIEAIQGIYSVRLLNDHQFRVHFDSPVETLKKQLLDKLSLTDQDVTIKQLHSWLKTNAWK
ncbi:hypothetical protein [Beduini massiliensis]|uniref:hypothetical protein n=1 Tax=Beduini massiliensis TaxID=1585974 RepID=UPI00059A7B83|nr:hypothetical protein [Beduini massiliensis]